jgi:hypothetical protein
MWLQFVSHSSVIIILTGLFHKAWQLFDNFSMDFKFFAQHNSISRRITDEFFNVERARQMNNITQWVATFYDCNHHKT